MAKFDEALKEIRDGIVEIAKTEGADFAKELCADGEEFLAAAREDLKRWTGQLARGELKAKEFQRLVRGKKSVAEMRALKQLGIAAARIDKIRSRIIDLVITVLSKVL